MKKNYVTPQTEIVDIDCHGVLMASATGLDIIDDATNGDEGLSRDDVDMLFGNQSFPFNLF